MMNVPAVLLPGVFANRVVNLLARPGAKELIGYWNTVEISRWRLSGYPRGLPAMVLIDWYTQPRLHAQDGLPLPGYVLDALAAVLPSAKHRQRYHADEARRLRDTMSVSDIGRRFGRSREHVQRVLFKAEGLVDRGWRGVSDVLAAVRNSTDDRDMVFDAARWFTERGNPLPYDLWWALVIALGLGRGTRPVLIRRGSPVITEEERREALADYRAQPTWTPAEVEQETAVLGPTADEVRRECETLGLTVAETARALEGLDVIRGGGSYGLTNACISAISAGLLKPEGFQAAAQAVGRARANPHSARPLKRFTGSRSKKAADVATAVSPLAKNAVAKEAAKATAQADGRRMSDDARLKAESRAKRAEFEGEEGDPPLSSRETLKDWVVHKDWDHARWTHEQVARWNSRLRPSPKV